VDAAAARGLREADVAQITQQHARLGGHSHGVVEVRARLGVEVQPQLVRMVGVLAPNRPGMERDRAHLAAPRHHGDLGRADLVGVAARRKLDPARLDVVRRALRDALLEEGVAATLLARGEHYALVHALRPALERRRPPAERTHDALVHRQVVLDHVELRDRRRSLRLREDHAIGARHPDFAFAGLDGGGIRLGHGPLVLTGRLTCK
jgi:hypothetical protein